MAESAPTRRALDAWTTTLVRMQETLADTLAKTLVPQSDAPADKEEAARTLLGQLDQRLADWETCLDQAARDVHAAESASSDEIAELQSWTAKMAAAKEKLASSVSRQK